MTLKRIKRRYSKFINYYYYCCIAKEISRGVLGTRVYPDTCRIRVDEQNSIWIRWIGVDMEMLEYGKKKLRIQKYPDTCGRGQGPKASLNMVDNNDAFVNVRN